MQDDLTLEGVNDDFITRPGLAMQVAQSDDGWNAQAPRDDGGVRCPASGIGRNRARVLEIQLGDRRGQ